MKNTRSPWFLFPNQNCRGVLPTQCLVEIACSAPSGLGVHENRWSSGTQCEDPLGTPDMLTPAEREKRSRSGLFLLKHCFMMKWASFNAVDPQGKEHTCRQTLPLRRLNACSLKVVYVIVRIEFSPLCLNMPVFNKFCLNYRLFFVVVVNFFFQMQVLSNTFYFWLCGPWKCQEQISHFLSECNEVDMFYLVAAKIQ